MYSKHATEDAMHRTSIATRLALWFALVALCGFSLIALGLNWVLKHELERHQLEQIQGRSQEMRYMLLHARAPHIAERMHLKLDAITPADGRARYWLDSPDPEFRYGDDRSEVMAQTSPPSTVEGGDAAHGTYPSALQWVRVGGHTYRTVREELPATAMRPAVTMVVGVDVRPFTQTAHSFGNASVWITLISVLLVSALGYAAAKVGLGPVARLTREIQNIGPDNRAQRVTLPALPNELAQLGISFNGALDRLDAAYQQLATFNDDVAHELRTPLGNLIGQTQVALTRDRSPEALRDLLASNLEELERLRLIVSDMLFLARADQGEKAQRLAMASLASETEKTVEFLEMLLDDAGLSVHIEGNAQAPIESALLRRALTNLLHNAMQYALPSSQIRVGIRSFDGLVEIAVQNAGPAIAEAHIQRIFDRFYRVDASRTNVAEASGHGLGLAIVKAVATMHGGQVFAYSEDGFTTIGLTIRATPERRLA